MTEKQFQELCSNTEIGTSLSLDLGGKRAHGRFLGCAPDGVVIETDGRVTIWPLDLLVNRRQDYPTPLYS
ncbi:MAG: hypothetical protein C0624_00785 [Desulfuromonas sp.]|nr:MAG: hypothetical protein C0624_00785 [Desulfuromonas sp.]